MKLFCLHQTKIWNYSASTKQKYEIFLLPPKQKYEIILLLSNKIKKLNYFASTKQKYESILLPPDEKFVIILLTPNKNIKSGSFPHHQNNFRNKRQLQFSENVIPNGNVDVSCFHHS